MAAIETIRPISDSHTMEADMPKERSRTSITSVLAWVETQLERRRSRRALLEMSDEQLKDIGISRGDAYREASRPMWL
jgi:uncharacterized protein YjiS (DUF1127 family)